MGTFGDIKTRITQVVGKSGANYETKLEEAVNFAQREVTVVKWRFLYKEMTFTTSQGVTIYDLWDNNSTYNDFGQLYGNVLKINDGSDNYRLIQASETDISMFPFAAQGRPKYFSISAMTVDDAYSTRVQAVKIGYPTADNNSGNNYTVTVPYYKVLADLSADSDVSDISYVYNDEPLVSFGVAKLWEMLEKSDKQQLALQEAYSQMNQMLAKVPYDGLSYFEIRNIPRPQQDDN